MGDAWTRCIAGAVLLVAASCGPADRPATVRSTGAHRSDVVSPLVGDERDRMPRMTVPPRASRSGERHHHQASAPLPTKPPRINAAGAVNGYPCGGDLPPCSVLRAESGGNPTAYNASGCNGRGCGGLWQFDPWTWRGKCRPGKAPADRCADYAGYAYAQDAPADVQNARARELWAGGAGCSHWAAC